MRIKCNVEGPWRHYRETDRVKNDKFLAESETFRNNLQIEIDRWENEATEMRKVITLLHTARDLNRMACDEIKAKNYEESDG